MGGLAWQGRRLAFLQAEQARWRAPALEVRDLRRRVFMIRRYQDRTYSALECLREISRVQPGGIDLSSFNYRKGEEVRISAAATAVELVYEFKNALDESALFGEASLQGPRTDRRKGREVFDVVLALPEDAS